MDQSNLKNINTKSNTIAVVGGGISGIITLKYLKDKNIKADLFEIRKDLTGLWSLKDGYTWEEMTTNISQYSCQIGDHFWKKQGEAYLPTSSEYYEYLKDYIIKNDLENFHNIILETKVEKINFLNEKNHYELLIKNKKLSYKNVICCTGVHNDYKIPNINGIEFFNGKIIHSSEYLVYIV